jgi:hypothetical protein
MGIGRKSIGSIITNEGRMMAWILLHKFRILVSRVKRHSRVGLGEILRIL